MPNTEVKTVLGFDFGTHWIGVAVGQTLTAHARPLSAIKSNHTRPDWQAIEGLLQDWQPQKLIVGLPTQLDGTNDEMTEPARKFARQLHGRYHLSIAMVDERLTTREAYNVAIESADYKSKPEIDSIAAVLITESWLREHNSR